MAKQKEQPNYVNPKKLFRAIMKSLPPVDYVRSTVMALWAHSVDWIDEDRIKDGTLTLEGTISYSQLADFCACGESTAKWRMVQLRDKFELVEWEPIDINFVNRTVIFPKDFIGRTAIITYELKEQHNG